MSPSSRRSKKETSPRRKVRGYGPRAVVKFHDDINLPYEDSVSEYIDRKRIGPWRRLTEQFPGVTIRRMFTSVEPARIRELVAKAVRKDDSYRPPNFLTYFVVDLPKKVVAKDFVKEISQWKSVETAYFDPPAGDPESNISDPRLSAQSHLDAQPYGIDARHAWGFQGGDGEGQEFIDLEQGWTLNHVDLNAHGAEREWGNNMRRSRPHGTSVLGVVCALDNGNGRLGIAPGVASVNVVSHSGSLESVPDVMLKAIDILPDGGLLLLEVDRLGIPVEAWQADFHKICLAIANGITVVEAAGNGLMNLDNFVDDQGKPVLRRAYRDSGAIMVAAATSQYPHVRMPFSNYGSRIDCYAHGENVGSPTSTPVAPYSKTIYTDNFNGTSSASAIIAGAALVVQGMAMKGSLGKRLNVDELRDVLKNHGTASANPVIEPIGKMPDLRAIIESGAIGVVPPLLRRYP